MSAGAFRVTRYEMNNGTILPIRVQPETIAMEIAGAANAAPAGAVTPNLGSVRVGGGKNQIGIRARGVTIRFNAGAAPAGYRDLVPYRLPILTPAVWNGIADSQAVDYLGGTATVVGKYKEETN